MIIGISGRIGSGKDTVAGIIQKLTETPIPDYGRVMPGGEWAPMKRASVWKIKKFAGALKKMASMFTGIPVEKFEDQEFKKTELGPEWGMTVREFLQKLGTEAIRGGLHTNAWVNALMSSYRATEEAEKKLEDDNSISFYVEPEDKWIVTDTRFPNEAQAIKDRGGIVVRVNRDLPDIKYTTLEELHPSETSLDNWKFDYVIDNFSSIEQLKENVKEMLEHFKIL